MGRVPRNSIASMAQKMQGLKIPDKTEKALMVRVGTLIDAIVEAQRGLSNPGEVTRRQNVTNLKKPKALTGSSTNVFNGAQISINASSTSANLSHYEAQISDDEQFSDPTQKDIFTTTTTFKGLVENQIYHIRIRPVTKDGQIGDWALLDTVQTTAVGIAADFDGTTLTESRVSKVFTFTAAEDMFTVACVPGITTTNDPAASTDGQIDITARRGLSGVYTDIETITWSGQAGSSTNITLNSGSDYSTYSQCKVYRGQALAFFNLIQADSTQTLPVDHTFDIQIANDGGASSRSSSPVVWIEF